MPARLRPTAPIAEDAILVGDPGRALMLAQELLEKPKMSNHARGLWGYSGRTPAGAGLTIQSTGMGGPSAALVLADLAELGVRRAVRVGTATALGPRPQPGELVLVTAAHSGLAPAATPALPDPELTEALAGELGSGGHPGEAISFDTLHPPGGAPAAPGDVADMQTAALLRRARELGLRVAAVLIVVAGAAGQLGQDAEERAAKAAGHAATAVLSG
ncbi:MAG: hypothetical protein ACM3NV_06210 [Syntrophothermus sp.]